MSPKIMLYVGSNRLYMQSHILNIEVSKKLTTASNDQRLPISVYGMINARGNSYIIAWLKEFICKILKYAQRNGFLIFSEEFLAISMNAVKSRSYVNLLL